MIQDRFPSLSSGSSLTDLAITMAPGIISMAAMIKRKASS